LGSYLESRTKKFHFLEIDLIIYFPRRGNKGNYRNYSVTFRDRKRKMPQPGKRIKLAEVLDKSEIDRGYPHTVGYYKVSFGKEANFKPLYLELRKIANVEEFWFLLNALDI